jgi:hypothetical protein
MSNETIRNKFNNLVKKGKDVYTIQEIIDYFGKDSIFSLLFLVTLPTSIPAPPQALGAETVFGGSLTVLLSMQLIMGFNKPILPKFITSKKINLGQLQNNKYYEKADKFLMKLESYFKKRYTFVFQNIIIKLVAALMIIPGVLMIIPLVFTNLFPSISVTLISFSFLFKDGLMLMVTSFFTFLVALFYLIFFKFIVRMGRKIMRRKKKNIAKTKIQTYKLKLRKARKILRTL